MTTRTIEGRYCCRHESHAGANRRLEVGQSNPHGKDRAATLDLKFGTELE